MKAAFVAAAAAAVLSGGVSAGSHAHARHAHDLFKVAKRNDTAVCVPGCTTIYSTITGSAGLWTPPAVPSTSSSVYANTTTAYPTTTPAPAPVPTTPTTTPAIVPQTCPTAGTYTFPATTVVVTQTEYVCGASSTTVPAGTHTLGGVTTVVTTATTVVCPYATTGVVSTTTYVCPSAGTYTIAPITTVVVEETVVVVPVVETYAPGTYTAPSVVTVVETATVFYCPLTSSTSEAPAPTYVAPAPTSTYVAPPPVATTATSEAPKPTGDNAQLGGGKNLGITYTPYRVDGLCKTAEEVMTDITAIKAAGINTIRVYSTDCDTLPNVGAACKAQGVKIIAGIFIGHQGCDNASPTVQEQISAIKEWAQWDMVAMVVIGNEAMFNGYCSVTQLRDLIVRVKGEFGGAGYTGLYTTTDVVSAWIGNDVSAVCEVIDVVGANAHAYFNAGTTPDQAGDFVAGQLKIVEDVCGKAGYILESGWPKAGKCFGVACAGETEQRTAIASIQSVIGDKTVLFSYHDDQWKEPGDCNCERHWGCGNLLGISA